MSECRWKPGDLIVWHHLPRGGYGYIHVVPGVVVKIGVGGKVCIAVRKTDGAVVTRWVKPGGVSSASGPVNIEMAAMIGESLQPRLRIVRATNTGGAK